MDRSHRNFDGQRHGQSYKLCDDGMVPLICPTCQNVFAGKASMPATPCYFAWGCFRYFSWEREPRRPCGCLSRDDRRVACRAVARVQRSPPSPDGLWRGSLRYEMACPAGQAANWRATTDDDEHYVYAIAL